MRWRRANILAPGFRASIDTHPLSRLHRSSVAAAVPVAPQNAGGTPAPTTIGPGKLYPVTAAQLLPNLTGFLTPLHNRNLQRTIGRSSGLRLSAQDLFRV